MSERKMSRPCRRESEMSRRLSRGRLVTPILTVLCIAGNGPGQSTIERTSQSKPGQAYIQQYLCCR